MLNSVLNSPKLCRQKVGWSERICKKRFQLRQIYPKAANTWLLTSLKKKKKSMRTLSDIFWFFIFHFPSIYSIHIILPLILLSIISFLSGFHFLYDWPHQVKMHCSSKMVFVVHCCMFNPSSTHYISHLFIFLIPITPLSHAESQILPW